MATSKRSKAARESVAFLAVGALALVALNALGVFVFGRVDFTEKRLFSLSDGSKRVARELQDSMTVTAYFTDELPPPFNATERYVHDLLDEYQAASKGKLRVRFVHPSDEEQQREAESAGVMRVAHQKIENDSVQVVEGYRGVVFEYLGEKKALPAIETTQGLEYEITQTIKELAGDKQRVGILKGHEGPTLEEGLKVLGEFTPTYELVEVDASKAIDAELSALLVIDPQTPLSETELRNIDGFVMGGGSLGVFGGKYAVAQDEQTQALTATLVDTGLGKMIEHWGVRFEEGIVGDAQCGQVAMRSSLGIPLPVPHPPVPMVHFDSEQAKHPIAFRLPQMYLPFTTGLEVSPLDGVDTTVLMNSSDRSWLLTGDSVGLSPRQPREWTMNGPRGPFALAVALEGVLPSAFTPEAMSTAESQPKPVGKSESIAPVHVFIVGSAGFMRDEFLPPPDRAGRHDLSSSLALALNAIDWLAQADELIAIRAKNVEDPMIEVPRNVADAELQAREAAGMGDEAGAIEALEKRKEAMSQWDTRKLRYRMLNTLGMPALLALYGVMRWQNRKRKKAQASV